MTETTLYGVKMTYPYEFEEVIGLYRTKEAAQEAVEKAEAEDRDHVVFAVEEYTLHE